MIKTALDKMTPPPTAKLLGWRLLDARPGEGWLKVAFDGKPEFCNPAGFVQGGILSAMLDDTMSPTALLITEGRLYPTAISLNVNFLAPARPGLLIAEANVAQVGKTIAFMEGKLTAEDGTALAIATMVARLLETVSVIR